MIELFVCLHTNNPNQTFQHTSKINLQATNFMVSFISQHKNKTTKLNLLHPYQNKNRQSKAKQMQTIYFF